MKTKKPSRTNRKSPRGRGLTWVYNPHVGGRPIPEAVRERIQQRILAHAAKHYAGKYARLDVRFHGALCYIDAYLEPDPATYRRNPRFPETRAEYLNRLRHIPVHLCRL